MMDIKKIYVNLSDFVDHQPLIGWLILVVLAGSLIVTIYQFAYHCGRFIATLF